MTRCLLYLAVAALLTCLAATPVARAADVAALIAAFDRMRTADVQDVLYLGEKRPVRIRLHLRIDGKPFRHAWDDFLARLFAYADVNGDKVLSTDEAVRLPQAFLLLNLVQGQGIFFPGNGSNAAPFDQLDANKDGKVTLAEMKAYYRKSGFAPVQMQPDPEQTTTQLLTDALFKQLDRDGDGKLSEKELKAAEESLRSLDLNEDELIAVEELIPGFEYGFGRGVPGMGGPGGNPSQPLVLVNRDDPPAQQVAPLLSRYDKDKNGKLSRAEIGLDEAAFTALDANKDGGLDAKELARWLAQPADLELLVPLSRPRGAGRASPSAEDSPVAVFNPDGRAMPLAASLRKKGKSALVLTEGTTLVEFQKEQGSQGNFRQVRQFYLEQFRGALRGKKHLDKKAAARSQFFKGLFPLLDRDGDGKVTEEELNAFLDLPARGAGCFTVVMLSQRGPCLFELLDSNHDKQLGLRELRGAWKSVAAWDANKDGALSKQELPRLFQVTLSAGQPGRGRIFFGGEEDLKPVAKERTAGPLWFRKADVNGDGDVSRREWLGTEEDFRRIDTDGDGLISLEEAIKADEWFRKKL